MGKRNMETKAERKPGMGMGHKMETKQEAGHAGKRAKTEIRGKKTPLLMAAAMLVLVTAFGPAMTVSASGAGNIISGKLNVLYGIVSSILSGIGMLVTLWGIGEWGFSYQGNEGMMQAHAFKRICGGLIVALAPEVLPLLL